MQNASVFSRKKDYAHIIQYERKTLGYNGGNFLCTIVVILAETFALAVVAAVVFSKKFQTFFSVGIETEHAPAILGITVAAVVALGITVAAVVALGITVAVAAALGATVVAVIPVLATHLASLLAAECS